MITSETTSTEMLKPLRTWSLLGAQRKQPTEYEIVSVNTTFRANERDKLELSTNLPMNRWYRRYGAESRMQHDDWNAFRDPDAITYRAYCTERDRDEVHVDRLLDQHAAQEYDAKLRRAWVDRLAAVYTPSRFLLHAAQMAAAYGVVMAPASTLINCITFQMGDQFRWVSRVAYRTAELRRTWPDHGFGKRERERWEGAREWQGFRELMERLLATYDWGESLLALNLVAMPAIDVSLGRLKAAADDNGDGLTRLLVDAQLRDSARRCRWMKRLMEFCAVKPDNLAFAEDVLARWMPLAQEAVYRYGEALGKGAGALARTELDTASRFY